MKHVISTLFLSEDLSYILWLTRNSHTGADTFVLFERRRENNASAAFFPLSFYPPSISHTELAARASASLMNPILRVNPLSVYTHFSAIRTDSCRFNRTLVQRQMFYQCFIKVSISRKQAKCILCHHQL